MPATDVRRCHPCDTDWPAVKVPDGAVDYHVCPKCLDPTYKTFGHPLSVPYAAELAAKHIAFRIFCRERDRRQAEELAALDLQLEPPPDPNDPPTEELATS